MDLGGSDARNVSRYLLQRLRSINEVLELREQRRREIDDGRRSASEEKSSSPRDELATAGTSAGQTNGKR
jgi:hypothetical protein